MSRAGKALLGAGSAILQISPHMAGAIDVIVVRQPDGTLKSSPFYGVWLQQSWTCTRLAMG